MDISGKMPQSVKLQTGFKWPREGIKYLGIFIPLSLQDLYYANYTKIIQCIKVDVDRWSVLPLSLVGRIESVRMNVRPRLFYLFQMLPVDIPKLAFNNLDNMLSKFIWQNKRPRERP